MKCPVHTTYVGKRKPEADCFPCNCIYATMEIRRIVKGLEKSIRLATERKQATKSLGAIDEVLLLLASTTLKSLNKLKKLRQ